MFAGIFILVSNDIHKKIIKLCEILKEKLCI